MRAKDALGEFGERVAAAHLESTGMSVLERRWRCRLGEVDIVALDGSCLVICEVKTRRSTVAGLPVEAVTRVKLARLRRLAASWLDEHGGGYPDVRIDVVSVLLPSRGRPVIEHLRGVS